MVGKLLTSSTGLNMSSGAPSKPTALERQYALEHPLLKVSILLFFCLLHFIDGFSQCGFEFNFFYSFILLFFFFFFKSAFSLGSLWVACSCFPKLPEAHREGDLIGSFSSERSWDKGRKTISARCSQGNRFDDLKSTIKKSQRATF